MLQLRYRDDSVTEIGVDEAGRGPLWGPMMAAAVIWPRESDWTDAHREIIHSIKDSKKIAQKKRERIAKSIRELATAYGIGVVGPDEIDTLGATRANQLAFRRALKSLYDSTEGVEGRRRVLIDGVLPMNTVQEGEEQITLVDGDALYLSIAAASIVAKVAHDTWVTEWCGQHIAEAAKYDLLSCKGYGTAKHRDGILKYGYTDLHRRLYLRKLIPDIVVSRYQIVEEQEGA